MNLRIIVKLSTSSYFNKNSSSMMTTKKLYCMSSLSNGTLKDLIQDFDSDLPVNLYDLEDGIYELTTCDETRDWETNVIDSYNLMLIPYSISDCEQVKAIKQCLWELQPK